MSEGPFRVKHPIFGEYSEYRPDPNVVEILDAPAADASGNLLPPKPLEADPPEKLTGKALEQALTDRGLPITGTADEKRAAVADHDAARVADPTNGGSATETTEV
ncbi:hypothetical protein QE370_000456 [Aeromicrobium sp. SORGH_AS981]|uniref:hypothetical protein n=1 Tax=Aeromicrobium sp. SORGH_AS_0981 TaxID=3041802 RepID=UPI0028662666|nr:hypothetical protein [Aeromicrobium sp. SORGH_AS_0981]MDR6117272.1 hypothetical protein [Aeromicrobium sp. SORGH_AS_0981]